MKYNKKSVQHHVIIHKESKGANYLRFWCYIFMFKYIEHLLKEVLYLSLKWIDMIMCNYLKNTK